MTPDEREFFILVDEYVRGVHCCFVAEMDLRTEETGYQLCFRPLGETIDSPRRYACKYLVFPTEQVRTASKLKALPMAVATQLDSELPSLREPERMSS